MIFLHIEGLEFLSIRSAIPSQNSDIANNNIVPPEDWLSRNPSVLIVMASLIATIAFQYDRSIAWLSRNRRALIFVASIIAAIAYQYHRSMVSKAMKATPADIIEYPNSYAFVVDMPGLKPDQIKVQVEDIYVLVVSGDRKREKEKDQKDSAKYLKMERRVGKLTFLKKFPLPKHANTEKISVVYQDGVLTVTVEKLLEAKPIEVHVA